jgi:hypothetical protein
MWLFFLFKRSCTYAKVISPVLTDQQNRQLVFSTALVHHGGNNYAN